MDTTAMLHTKGDTDNDEVSRTQLVDTSTSSVAYPRECLAVQTNGNRYTVLPLHRSLVHYTPGCILLDVQNLLIFSLYNKKKKKNNN